MSVRAEYLLVIERAAADTWVIVGQRRTIHWVQHRLMFVTPCGNKSDPDDDSSKHLITIARDKHEGEAGETKRGTERNDLVDLAVVMGRPPRPIFLRQVVMSDKGFGQGICYRKSDLCGDRV